MASLSFRQLLTLLPVMLPLMFNIKRSAQFYDGQFKPTRSRANRAFLTELENIAKKNGATAIKHVKVPRNAIFQHKGIPYEYAIMLTVEMDKKKISTALRLALRL
uniref:Iron-sulfur cluster enzyme family protein, amino terminus n=2 Tax=Hormoscilla spongeliae TaxID=190968 RepID=A0A1S6M1Q8_9CYAN|nr:truncated iron-sulfur cluster enzyme family protein, amino terminus [Hormoscilla spongeliae GUM034]AQU14206.1 iron-sulfur cluster enzyme family protein, amino terminus [Hormoscilla spongeliae SP4]